MVLVLLAAVQMLPEQKAGRYSDYSSMENVGVEKMARQRSTNTEKQRPRSVFKSWLIRFRLATRAKIWNALELKAPTTSTDLRTVSYKADFRVGMGQYKSLLFNTL